MNLKTIMRPALSSFFVVVGLALFSQYGSSSLAFLKETTASTVSDVITTVTPIITATLTPIPTTAAPTQRIVKPVATKAPAPKPAAACIVTINGARYNVQNLRRTHSGGDIFKCGTDMTATFRSQHGTNYGLIAKYKI